jgi:adenine phosphoribosyltransferase
MELKDKIRTMEFKGVKFHDVCPLLKDPEAFRKAIKEIADKYRDKSIDSVVGIEARGFIFGAAVAYELGVGFVPIRKKGKLPGDVVKREHKKEYGTGIIEMQKDAISKGERILVVDDLLATGGTVRAAVEMVEEIGGDIIGIVFIINMSSLRGMEEIKNYEKFFLIDDRDLQ